MRTTSTSCGASGCSFDPVDRRDPFVAARAASRAVALGAHDEARGWLRPFWDESTSSAPTERSEIAEALAGAVAGIGAEWLPRLEAASRAFPRDGAIALAVGPRLAERAAVGQGATLLEQAANDTSLSAAQRRKAWVALARLAQQEGDGPSRRRASSPRPGWPEASLVNCKAQRL